MEYAQDRWGGEKHIQVTDSKRYVPDFVPMPQVFEIDECKSHDQRPQYAVCHSLLGEG